MAEDFVRIAKSKIQAYSNPNKDELSKELLRFFEVLSNVGAEFGYRSAIEIHRFASLAVHFAKDWTLKQAIDASVAQKLLPKLHGSRRKLERSEEHTSELQSRGHLVCRLLLEKKNKTKKSIHHYTSY